jgi:hypothetical protein
MARQARQTGDPETGRTRTHALAWLAWTFCALCVALAVVTALLGYQTPDVGPFVMGAGVALLVYPTVGALVVSRRPKNPVGYILLGLGIVLEVQVFASAYSSYARSGHPDLPFSESLGYWLTPWTIGPTVVLGLVLLVLLFPDGRLPASYFRGVVWMAVGGSALVSLWWFTWSEETALGRFVMMMGQFGDVLLFLSCVTSVFAVLERLQSAGARERQQLKWFGYGAALFLIAVFFLTMADEQTNEWLVFAVIVGGLSAIPVAVGIAMLRYRLYDVDVIINRTLVYGSLTVLLVIVYLGAVTATQAVFHTLTDQEKLPQLAIVASTLVIAALFTPLRRRIQSFIDRRFYRRKYNARKTLETFSAKLRDETDLEALSDDLVGVVRETVQPAHVSLWLRPDTAMKSKAGTPRD